MLLIFLAGQTFLISRAGQRERRDFVIVTNPLKRKLNSYRIEKREKVKKREIEKEGKEKERKGKVKKK